MSGSGCTFKFHVIACRRIKKSSIERKSIGPCLSTAWLRPSTGGPSVRKSLIADREGQPKGLQGFCAFADSTGTSRATFQADKPYNLNSIRLFRKQKNCGLH